MRECLEVYPPAWVHYTVTKEGPPLIPDFLSISAEALAIPLLILVNAIFVASEFVIVTARRTRIQKLVARGNRRARLVAMALDRQREYIATTQVGITMASLALGWLGEPILARAIGAALFSALPPALEGPVAHAVAIVCAFALITGLTIVLGELAPKSAALIAPERTALFVIPATYIFMIAFRPLTRAMNALATMTLRLIGLRGVPVGHHVVTSEDFTLMASESVQAGLIGEEEARIVQRTFRFAGRQAHDVMVPRTDVKAVGATANLAEVAGVFRETGFTRLPVFQESLDNITGVVHSKDILSHMSDERQTALGAGLVRPIMAVPESKDLAELLDQMRRERTHIAVVVDEYGVTAGVVTMEDLVEEIVGEITSEHRKEEGLIEWVDDRTVVVDAAMPLADLNYTLGVELGEEDINTLGGYVFRELGRVPSAGERFAREDIAFVVLTMDRNRVGDVRLSRSEPWPRAQS